MANLASRVLGEGRGRAEEGGGCREEGGSGEQADGGVPAEEVDGGCWRGGRTT